MSWLSRHATAIGSASALITAAVAVLALLGVKLQIDASADLQAHQSARDIYRGFLELSIANPQYSKPQTCTGSGDTEPGYDAYVDYLLYTTEQITGLDHSWGPVMEHWLLRHRAQLCTLDDLDVTTPEVAKLIAGLKSRHCGDIPACD
jgi:hypothetical protein